MTLNIQGDNGIEWTHVFGKRTGRTWNVPGGCLHKCVWEMPDKSLAECYAKTTADNLRSDRFYPHGFEHHYWHPDRLNEPLKLKTPAGIFLDSMSDLMGHWVTDDEIKQVLDVCAKADWHVFQLLTKNAPRLAKFDFPANVWVGVSAPPTFMFGRRLSHEQQLRMLTRAMDTLRDVKASVKWMSVEPLSWDIAADMINHPLNWVVIGAATNGRKVYQPEPEWVTNLLTLFDSTNTPVFFKGNLRGNPAASVWREQFPTPVKIDQIATYQATLL